MEVVALIDDGEGAGGAVAAMADSDDEAHSDVDAAVEARPAGSRARTAFEAEAAALDHRLLQGDRVGGEWAVAEADADTVGDAEALARMRKCLWGAEGLLANRGYLPHESGYLPPETVSGWKLLRFLRGNGGKVEAALAAFEKMLLFRDTRDVDTIRAALVESAGLGPNAPLEKVADSMVWPYHHPKFAPLIDEVWGPDDGSPEASVPPVVQIGSDPNTGGPITWSAFERYNFPQIAALGKGPMWMELVQWCDVYFDILLHVRSVQRGCLVKRRDIVDAQSTGLSALSGGAIGLLRKMESLSIHYPEVLGHTDLVNFGSTALAVWSAVSMLLPKATREKFATHGAGQLALGLELPSATLPRRLGGTSLAFTETIDRLFLQRDVPARGSIALQYIVTEECVGTAVEWEILGLGVTDGWSVRVGIEFFTKPGPDVPAVAVMVLSSAVPKTNSVRDTCVPVSAGTFAITVVNDALLQSKHIRIRIRQI
eukprot:m.180387 g.180387  ORF g.180387 m.180387 type:complete len:485 (-) comp24559_c1_seq1:293-1747(-)